MGRLDGNVDAVSKRLLITVAFAFLGMCVLTGAAARRWAARAVTFLIA